MNESETLKFYKRNLPHWLVSSKNYFVTIRKKNTLPKEVIQKFKEKCETLTPLEKKRAQFKNIEHYLDKCSLNISDLKNPHIAQMIFENLQWFKTKGWTIYVATIMPNHIHLLMGNSLGRTKFLLEDLAGFKRFTARKANKILQRTGSFWAREDFDHWLRGNNKFEQVVNYIINNPVSSNLVSNWKLWQWTYVDEELIKKLQ